MQGLPLRLLLAAAALVLAHAAAAANTIAFVTEVRGEARVANAGRVAFLAEYLPATTLVLDKGARVTLIYSATGAEYILNGPGEFLLEAGEVKVLKGAAPARRNVTVRPDAKVVAQVSQSATASLRMRSISTPPRPQPPAAIQYPKDSRISTLQPTLRWTAEAGKTYAIVVTQGDGKEAWRGSAKSGSVRLPVKLAAGSRYGWNVASGTALVGDAWFETLPSEAIAKADKSRAGAKTFSDRIVHAFVLQDIGAAQDAKDAWAALARERPDLPELAALAK